ncbi:MAG: PQQ-binding-like beta-propeller repeat protein [Kiritimatiellaceae bacterium]|nr:PQQ-binding-like beta-propeller repeat protein [Kiritimatiellaceae bacterium]
MRKCVSAVTISTLLSVLFIAVATASESQTQFPSPGTGRYDWPQHGGTIFRNAVSDTKGLPDSFEVGSEQNPRKNIKWVAPIGAKSMGVPVIANGKVYLAADAKDGSPKYPLIPKRGALYCFDEKTGEMLWQFIGKEKGVTSGQFGLTTAPVVESNRLYLCGGNLQFFCLTTDGLFGTNAGPFVNEALIYGIEPPQTLDKTDADVVWMFDIEENISNVHYHNAYAFAPLVYGDYVYATTGNCGWDKKEFEKLPRPRFNEETPSLMVLNKKTGKLIAVDNEKMSRNIIHGQWGTPSVGMVNGKAQILFGGCDGKVYAFDPAPKKWFWEKTGTLKAIWSFDPNFYLKGSRRFEIYGAPVCNSNRVFVSLSEDWTHPKEDGIIVCIDATKKGDITETGKIWECRGVGLINGAVSISKGLLYAADLYGKVHCIDEGTGELYWTFDTQFQIRAGTLVADGKIFVGNGRGEFFIFKEGKDMELLHSTKLNGQINGLCSAANGCLYIVAGENLYAIQKDADRKQVAP